MKKTVIPALIFGLLSALQTNLVAQDDNQVKTLFDSDTPLNAKDIGFFVAPKFGFTQMDGSGGSLFNLRTGINLKDKLSFGAYFNTSMNEIRPQSETLPNIYMDNWTFGGFAEYTILSKKVLHLTFPLYIGYGEVQMDNENGDAGLGEANFLQVEPAALLEVNLHKTKSFITIGDTLFINYFLYITILN